MQSLPSLAPTIVENDNGEKTPEVTPYLCLEPTGRAIWIREPLMNAPNKLHAMPHEETARPDVHALFARLPRGPMAEMVGWNCIGFEDGVLTLGFTPKPFFCNPMGMIHGGFVASMLDESMGSAILATTEGKSIGATISATIDFIRPAMLGSLTTTARVRNLGKSIAFVEAELWSAERKLLAKSTASFKLVALEF